MLENLLNKFNKTEQLISKERLYTLYGQVSKDLEQEIKDEGVWAKAYADADGEPQKTKAIYIELMVERLILVEDVKSETRDKLIQDQAAADAYTQSQKSKGEWKKNWEETGDELDRFRTIIRLPATLIIMAVCIWLSIGSYEAIGELASFIFIPLGAFASWFWFWLKD